MYSILGYRDYGNRLTINSAFNNIFSEGPGGMIASPGISAEVGDPVFEIDSGHFLSEKKNGSRLSVVSSVPQWSVAIPLYKESYGGSFGSRGWSPT